MYESYPSQAAPQQPQQQHVQAPPTVRNAIRLMYAGAGLEVIALVVALVTAHSFRSAILKAHPGYTAAQLNTAEHARGIALAVGALITIGLWLWMAWANGKGHNWARIVSAVFFGINTLDLLLSVFALRDAPGLILGVVIWLVGLAALLLIFNRESRPFYSQPAAV